MEDLNFKLGNRCNDRARRLTILCQWRHSKFLRQ